MSRPSRNIKAVDYSQFDRFDNGDDDFACVKAPPSKKARVMSNEQKQQKPIKKFPTQELESPVEIGERRISRDEKSYQRDLEAALALSMLQEEDNPQKIQGNNNITDADNLEKPPLLSNCSVDSSILGLDKIIEENASVTAHKEKRQAATKAAAQQQKIIMDENGTELDEDKYVDYQPECTSESDSRSDTDLSEEDEEFNLKKKSKCKKNKKSNCKVKKHKSKMQIADENISSTSLRKRQADAKAQATQRNMPMDDSGVKGDGHLDSSSDNCESGEVQEIVMKKGTNPKNVKKEAKQKKSKESKTKHQGTDPDLSNSISIFHGRSPSSTPSSKPILMSSPTLGSRIPKWTPPAKVGVSPSTNGRISVKSPSQGLRLGLSRFAKIKPLHPAATSSSSPHISANT
ncbi:RAD51-associated protein 1 isoform X2 [Polypterus senegalus]|uniref:RAD51-associated protein 1 isoform X2 n=1 Tax=Polypterus senegalus TaxID=55291 RepID=UPI0019640BDA|nr:RAD51-associated protein 1 isoform X2 [Polypterus senegalus]